MGEYARSLAIASAVASRWPEAQIHFALSGAAPYSAGTPFPSTLLPASPTFHTKEVVQIIRDFRPTVIIFDNAGRTAQLRAAARCGARLVFVSSRQRQRRRAFRVRWMRLLDEHWIAWPEFIAGRIGAIEAAKLRILGRPVIRFLDTILPPADTALDQTMLARFNVRSGDYVLVVPGGGSDHPGAEDAPQIVADASRRIAMRGLSTILVGVASANETDNQVALLHFAPRMPMTELAALIRNARLVISNGGDTLLQTICCQRPCLAVAIAGDQAYRIEQCVAAGLAVRAELNSEHLAHQALTLLDDDSRRATIARQLAGAGISNGLETALAALQRLATAPHPDSLDKLATS